MVGMLMTFSGTQWQWLRGGENSSNTATTMRPLPRSRPASPLSQWFPSHSPSTNLAAGQILLCHVSMQIQIEQDSAKHTRRNSNGRRCTFSFQVVGVLHRNKCSQIRGGAASGGRFNSPGQSNSYHPILSPSHAEGCSEGRCGCGCAPPEELVWNWISWNPVTLCDRLKATWHLLATV